MMSIKTIKPFSLLAGAVFVSGFSCGQTAWSEDQVPAPISAVSSEELTTKPKVKGSAALLMEEIVTTSRKKSKGEEV